MSKNKSIDLDKIIEDKTGLFKEYGEHATLDKGQCLDCMKEAIKQVLELACERAECNVLSYSLGDVEVDKESIMSIMDEL